MSLLALLLAAAASTTAPSPTPADDPFAAAQRALLAHDLETAKRDLLAGLDADPTRVDAMDDLANVCFLQKDDDGAASWYAKALARKPDDAHALNGSAILRLQAGDLDGAVDLFVRAAKADPADPLPIDNLGDTALAVGDAQNAATYFEVARKVDPGDAHAAVALAELRVAEGPQQADDAIAMLKPVLASHPDDAAAKAAMGKALATKGRWSDAIGFLDDAAKAMPRDPAVHYALGIALMNAGRLPDAADAFLAALDVDDADPRLHLELGVVYYEMHDARLVSYASQEFHHTLDRNPAPADRASADYHLGLIEDDAGRLDKALGWYHEALKSDPNHVGALNDSGLILVRRGKPADAVPLYQRALAAQSDFSPARLNLAQAWLKLGRKEDALRELDKLASLPDGDPIKQRAASLRKDAAASSP